MNMSAANESFKHILAFEVSKRTLVVHRLPGDVQHEIANTPAAIRKLLKAEVRLNRSKKLGRMLVVAEATGGYEENVLETAVQLGLTCHKAHGSRVRDFARYLGVLAKTDRIDGRVLARYALKSDGLRLYQPPSPAERALRELKGRRDELIEMRIAERNRLEHARCPRVVSSRTAMIRALEKAVKAIEMEIAVQIHKSEVLAQKARLMRSLTGIGPTTAATLMAYMPELGHLTKGEAAALAGLAPINRDSGATSAPRHIRAGRHAIRRTLYMAALVASQKNPVFRNQATALRARGKPFKVVITALMRKLIVTLNAILKSGQPWLHAKSA